MIAYCLDDPLSTSHLHNHRIYSYYKTYFKTKSETNPVAPNKESISVSLTFETIFFGLSSCSSSSHDALLSSKVSRCDVGLSG